MSMRFIEISGLHAPVSQLIMGSMMLSDERTELSNELLDAYIAVGGNAIDTAFVYGSPTMKAIGNWMQSRGNRKQLAIIAKGAHHDATGPRVTRDAIASDIADSLQWMKTDYVDIFMLHRDDPALPVGAIIELLQEPLADKRCRALGASNWTTARIAAANAYAQDHGLVGFSCSSPNLSLAKPNEPRWPGCVSAGETDIAWHRQTQLPLLSWSSQAGGFFTGRYSPDRRDDPEAVRVYYNDANWQRYERAKELAAHKNADANQIALSYVLHQPFPTCALIGPRTPQEVISSCKALDVNLTADEVRALAYPDIP